MLASPFGSLSVFVPIPFPRTFTDIDQSEYDNWYCAFHKKILKFSCKRRIGFSLKNVRFGYPTDKFLQVTNSRLLVALSSHSILFDPDSDFLTRSVSRRPFYLLARRSSEYCFIHIGFCQFFLVETDMNSGHSKYVKNYTTTG